MTKLTEFLAGRKPAEMYEDYWVPRTLWPHSLPLAETVSPGDNVLDMGAGTGLLTDLAAARMGVKGHITAIDPTPFMQEVLHQKFDDSARVTLIDSGYETANLPHESFDVILCNQVVQYLPDVQDGFHAMYSLLKPGGKLAVGVWARPADQQASPLEDGFAKHFGEGFAPIHAWSFGGLSRLNSLADKAGFAVERLETEKSKCRFTSVEELMLVHVAGGMRVENDEVLMGIFDLSDASFEPKVEALYSDLKAAFGQFESPEGLDIEFASDVLIARK